MVSRRLQKGCVKRAECSREALPCMLHSTFRDLSIVYMLFLKRFHVKLFLAYIKPSGRFQKIHEAQAAGWISLEDRTWTGMHQRF